MNEKINNSTLYFNDYKGNDLYCDGAIENQLLEIVKNHEQKQFDSLIETSARWEMMYHLSSVRENILSWYPFKKDSSILEIGSGCGAVSGSLCKGNHHVVCIDLSKQRSYINAYRHKEEKLDIHVGNFEDIHLDEKFDYVTLIGVLEYGGSYIHAKSPYVAFLKKATNYLKPDGKLLIAIENRIGLKYWAGCREDHLGTFFENIEGYRENNVRTFTRKELKDMLKEVDLGHMNFYYPYPDYKFAHTIFSDRHLPTRNECNDNMRNFDRDRMQLFDENKVFNTLIENEMFPDFSNSFFIEASREEIDTEITYAKFSQGNRAREFQVKTTIHHTKKEKHVKKEPINNESALHVQQMLDIYSHLKTKYEKTAMHIVETSPAEGGIQFSYAEGETLEAYLLQLANKGQIKEMIKEIEYYFNQLFISAKKGKTDSSLTKIFGDLPLNSCTVMDYINIDALFSNVKKQDNQYTMFDYEWVIDGMLPIDYVKYRCLFYFIQSNKCLANIDLYLLFNITEKAQKQYQKMEENFQNYVHKGKLDDKQLYTKLGQITIKKEDIYASYQQLASNGIIQIYFDRGNGYSEKDSIHLVAEEEKQHRKIEFAVMADVNRVRIDPMSAFGMVHIEKLYAYHAGNSECFDLTFATNGKAVTENFYLFLTEDPVIELDEVDLKNYQIVMELEIWPLEKGIACWLSKQLGNKQI